MLVSHELNLTLQHASPRCCCWTTAAGRTLLVAELSARLLSACLGHPLLEIQRDGRRYWCRPPGRSIRPNNASKLHSGIIALFFATRPMTAAPLRKTRPPNATAPAWRAKGAD